MNQVGVAISTWRRPDDLRRCLKLLFAQDHPFDLFVVDNCSEDGTVDVLEEFDIDYQVMPHSNFSAIHTINLALRELSNDYIIILDDDTFLEDPTIISKLVKTANTDSNIAIVATNVRDHLGRVSLILKTLKFDAVDYKDVSNEEFYDIDDFSGACALFRRELVGPTYYDESFKIYWNEPELAIRMVAAGHRVVINQRAVVIHGSDVGRESCRSFYFGSRNTFRLMTKVLPRKSSLILSFVMIPLHFKRYLRLRNDKNFYRFLTKIMYSYVQNMYRCIFAERIRFNDMIVYKRVCNTYTKYFLKEIFMALEI